MVWHDCGLGNARVGLGETARALEYFQLAASIDAGFRDVTTRVAALATPARPAAEGPERSEIDQAFDDLMKD